MSKLSRKVWVTMLTLALIISQLLPTGMLAITAAAEDGIEIEEELKKEAPATEEKKAEAAPVEEKKVEAPAMEEEKKLDAPAAEEKKEAVEIEKIKEVDKIDELMAEEKIEEEAVEEKAEEKVARDLMFFKKYNTMFSVDSVAYYDYNGQNQTLYPTFNKVDNKGVIDSQGRWIIHLKRMNEVNTQTYYLTPKFVGVTTQKNAGSYKVGAVIEAAKIEDAYGNDVTARVDANWGNNDYYTFGVVSYEGVIRPKDISVKLNNVSKVYGQKDPDISTWASVTKGSLASGDNLAKVLNLVRAKGEDVGEYPFSVALSSNGGGEAAAKKAAKSVSTETKETFAEKEKIEDAIAVELKPEVASAPQRVGNYNIVFENKEGKLTITPAPVTITALDNGKVKGTKDPVLKYKVDGLLNGETLPEGFVYDHKRAAGEEVGKYPINLAINLNAESGSSATPATDDEIIDVPVVAEKEEWAEAKEEWAKEELKAEYAEEVYHYAAKSVKKADAREASDKIERIYAEERVKEAVDWSSLLERIDFERIDELIPAEQEKPVDVITPEIPGGTPAIVVDEKPTYNGFKSKNYTFKIVKGTFTITGKSNGGAATTNNGGNDGGDDLVVADVNDAATPAAAPAAPAASTAIPDAATPLAGGNGAWALVNLICTILAGLGAIVAIFRRKEEEDDENACRAEDEEDNRGKKMFAAKTAGILTAIAAVITFILTEDMRLPMIMIDKWTLLMVIMLAVQIVAAVLNKKAAEAEEDEEAETVSAN